MFQYLLFLLVASLSLARITETPAALRRRDIYAQIADNTCKWSNSGEPCSTGFVSVRRHGTKGNGMMWDHTQCPRGGLSTFCCPANTPHPTCLSRGHKNKGKCKPGCEANEVEVWSIKLGCRSGHQSACCMTNAKSVEAYTECRWRGNLPNVGAAKPVAKSIPTRQSRRPLDLGALTSASLVRRPSPTSLFMLRRRVLVSANESN